MKCYCDLHLHSCLSPCGDELMTPNNIVKMAMLKGLDMIAVSDHNSARQLPAVEKVAREFGVALLPAMELNSREEAHMLAYFPTAEAACAFSEEMYRHLPEIMNRPEFFGPQTQLDENDEPIGTVDKLLIQALDLPVDKLAEMVWAAGGLPVPAHITRGGNGILNALGFLPPGVKFAALELSPGVPCPKGCEGYPLLTNSDAHRLEDIFEREHYLELETPDAAGFFKRFAV